MFTKLHLLSLLKQCAENHDISKQPYNTKEEERTMMELIEAYKKQNS